MKSAIILSLLLVLLGMIIVVGVTACERSSDRLDDEAVVGYIAGHPGCTTTDVLGFFCTTTRCRLHGAAAITRMIEKCRIEARDDGLYLKGPKRSKP